MPLFAVTEEIWFEFAKTFGFPALIALLFLLGAYKATMFYVAEVAKPMSLKIMESIDKTDRAIIESLETLHEISKSMTSMAATNQVFNERLTRIEEALKRGSS
ncbi:MAG: hypothetical protein AB7G28_26335 [Pirellulales bacterium]